jgi:hypothetical protein
LPQTALGGPAAGQGETRWPSGNLFPPGACSRRRSMTKCGSVRGDVDHEENDHAREENPEAPKSEHH